MSTLGRIIPRGPAHNHFIGQSAGSVPKIKGMRVIFQAMKKFLTVTLASALLLAALLSCSGGKARKQADLSAFARSLQEQYEFAACLGEMDPDNEHDKDTYERTFPGLLDLDLEQRINLIGMITLNNGEIGLAQAKNEEDAAKVKDIFQHRVDYMVETGAFYPGPVELWTNNSRIEVNGTCVLLVCAEECDAIVDAFNALFA